MELFAKTVCSMVRQKNFNFGSSVFHTCRLSSFSTLSKSSIPLKANHSNEISDSVHWLHGNISAKVPSYHQVNNSYHFIHNQYLMNKNRPSNECVTVPLLSRISSQFLPSVVCPSRGLTRYGLTKGRMRTVRMIVKRFRRLGNGLWLSKQPSRRAKVWKKLLTAGGPGLANWRKRTLICSKKQSKLLDKMVADHWKRQKWYVDDPYKGYTEETLLYYHPKKLPWNSTDKPHDYYSYALNRYNLTNKLRKARKKKHSGVCNSYRQKPIPSTRDGYCFS